MSRAALVILALAVVATSAPEASARRDPTARLRPEKKSKKAKKAKRANKAKQANKSEQRRLAALAGNTPRLTKLIPAPGPEPAYVEPALLGEPMPPPIVATVVAVEPMAEPTEVTTIDGVATVAVTLERELPRTDRTPRFEASVDSGPVMRSLRYRDDWKRDGESVRDYDLTANAIALQLTARPTRAIELIASGELLVRVAGSTGPDAMVHRTSSSEVQAGARFLGDLGPVRGGLDVAIGQHRFAIADEMSTFGELVPDTTYRYVRVGASAAIPVTRALQVTSAVAYRTLLGTGDLASAQWFPQATGGGVDVALGLEVKLTRSIHAHVRGQVRRYFFAMHPEVGDALVVGGALDQYVSLAAGLSVSIR